MLELQIKRKNFKNCSKKCRRQQSNAGAEARPLEHKWAHIEKCVCVCNSAAIHFIPSIHSANALPKEGVEKRKEKKGDN